MDILMHLFYGFWSVLALLNFYDKISIEVAKQNKTKYVKSEFCCLLQNDKIPVAISNIEYDFLQSSCL